MAIDIGAGLYSQPNLPTLEQDSNLLSNSYTGGNTHVRFVDQLILPGALNYLDARIALEPSGRVRAGQAVQLSAGVHARLTATLGLDATAFHRRVHEYVLPLASKLGGAELPVVERGSVTQGVELPLRKDLSGRLFGWIAYTLMRSQDAYFASNRLVPYRPADFDQRHNFVALLGVKLPRRWEIGARFRVVTGLPYTPVVGGVKQEAWPRETYPLFGVTNSARLGTFHQLDLRVDKTWVLRRSVVAAYVDVQNVYDRQNPEGLLYSEDFTSVSTVIGVPILPVVGVHIKY